MTDESSVRQGLETAAELGTLRGVVNAAGIVLAEKVLGRNGAALPGRVHRGSSR